MVDQLPSIFDQYKSYINFYLKSGLDQKADSELSSSKRNLYNILSYGMGWTDQSGSPVNIPAGKLLRPTLCLFATEASGGKRDRAIKTAVALEYIHNFSLFHDDIQDQDEIRHHRPTVWFVWGKPKAITAGNVLRSIADVTLSDLHNSNIEDTDAVKISTAMTTGYLEMIEGQFMDLSYESRHDITVQEYLEMISHKTGALIRCSMELGAHIGSGNTEVIRSFRESGRALGYLFQITDDVLGVWGDKEKTGKPVGQDIARKKNSLPVVHALSNADKKQSSVLKNIYCKQKLDDNDVDSVLKIMDSLGTKIYIKSLVDAYSESALQSFSLAKVDSKFGASFEELVQFLSTRNH
tara:strand:+ start:24666 stop:25721 length:1056 start_codon:yes stop_codon:yes gene_type:complete